MFLSKREKVASQEIRGNFLDERQRVCIAIFNESTQEPSIEPESMSGKLSSLAVNQKGIGYCPDIIPLRNFKNRLLMVFIKKHSGFSFLNSLFTGEKPLILGEPPMGCDPMTSGLRIDCSECVNDLRHLGSEFKL